MLICTARGQNGAKHVDRPEYDIPRDREHQCTPGRGMRIVAISSLSILGSFKFNEQSKMRSTHEVSYLLREDSFVLCFTARNVGA